MSSPELKQNISPDGNANQRSTADLSVVHHAGDIAGVLLHCGRPIPHARISVPAQIRQDDAIARAQSLSHRQPEFMIRGKRMQQNCGRAFAQDAVDDLPVATFYSPNSRLLHELAQGGFAETGFPKLGWRNSDWRDLGRRDCGHRGLDQPAYGFVTRSAPIGAASNSGSSGMTIQAMG